MYVIRCGVADNSAHAGGSIVPASHFLPGYFLCDMNRSGAALLGNVLDAFVHWFLATN
jgi:hypothetical protein